MLMGHATDMTMYMNVPVRFTLSGLQGDIIFYNEKFGRTIERVTHQVSFTPCVKAETSLEHITDARKEPVYLKGVLYWTQEPDVNNNGTTYRNGVIAHDQQVLRVKVWRIHQSLHDGVLYHFSDMNVSKKKFLVWYPDFQLRNV